MVPQFKKAWDHLPLTVIPRPLPKPPWTTDSSQSASVPRPGGSILISFGLHFIISWKVLARNQLEDHQLEGSTQRADHQPTETARRSYLPNTASSKCHTESPTRSAREWIRGSKEEADLTGHPNCLEIRKVHEEKQRAVSTKHGANVHAKERKQKKKPDGHNWMTPLSYLTLVS